MTFNTYYKAVPQCMLNNIFILFSRRSWYVKHRDFFIASKKLVLKSNAVIQQLDLKMVVNVLLLSIRRLKFIVPFCCFPCFKLYLNSYFTSILYFVKGF